MARARRLPSACLSAWSESFRSLAFDIGLAEQLGERDTKGSGQSVQHVNGRVLSLPLQSANVCPIHAGIEREPLLRDAALNPEPAQVPGYQPPAIHWRRRPIYWLLNHCL